MDDSGRQNLASDSGLNRALAEYRRRTADGEEIDREQFIAEHPDLAESLRSWFATSSSVERAATSAAAPGDEPVDATTYRALSSRETIPPSERPVLLESAADRVPEDFGRYKVLRCLGQGAMGAVYLAADTQLDREVALKIPKFSSDDDPELLQRFYREAQAAATLRHAHVCPLYDVGEFQGIPYLTMAYIEGRPLSEVIKSGPPISESRAVEIVLKLARALRVAHDEGVIHRDLKPANVMIDEHDEPIIMDFGLARRMNCDDARLTQAGLVVGSPAYMSPEQVEGDLEAMGKGCDIYSLGVIFYELLTGEIPFKGSVAAVMGQIITATPKRPTQVRPGVDPRLEAICLKMMAKKPADRFPSMREVIEALSNYQSMTPPPPSAAPSANEGSQFEILLRDAAAAADDASRVVLRPWMIWTAVAVVIAGFGVMSWMIGIALRGLNEGPAAGFGVEPAAVRAIEDRQLALYLNGELVPPDRFSEPIVLPPGKHKLEIRRGDESEFSSGYTVRPGTKLKLTVRLEENGEFRVDQEVTDDPGPPAGQSEPSPDDEPRNEPANAPGSSGAR